MINTSDSLKILNRFRETVFRDSDPRAGDVFTIPQNRDAPFELLSIISLNSMNAHQVWKYHAHLDEKTECVVIGSSDISGNFHKEIDLSYMLFMIKSDYDNIASEVHSKLELKTFVQNMLATNRKILFVNRYHPINLSQSIPSLFI